MKLYYPKNHINNQFRRDIFPLLKPFLKPEAFTDAERMALYGVSDQDYKFVNTIQDTEVAILPMSWNYYYNTNQLSVAKDFIEDTQKYNKPIWIAMLGDFGLPIPDYPHGIVFRASGYQSQLPNNHQGMPVFINDPLQTYYSQSSIFKRPYHKKPTVGFCGQASMSAITRVKELVKITARNLAYYTKQRPYKPEAMVSSSFLRGRVLRQCEQSPLVKTNFLIRTQYRAGAKTAAERHASSVAFYDNMKTSDYIICARGAGNFSVRLYETLAMGRIPVYINTDGLLPLQDTIDWKKHVVWVEVDELDMIGQKVFDFHSNLNQNQFDKLCQENRMLWKNTLQLKGFFIKSIETF
ncbi:exostosin domain-containing protein [Mangrovimonas cancribranchiae]|uniref:Exostosin family protein n=1 Tax=Mangrovimonas cancribranchiae TaxID=3080055 RepID=A0AAU6P9B8_9FLAO